LFQILARIFQKDSNYTYSRIRIKMNNNVPLYDGKSVFASIRHRELAVSAHLFEINTVPRSLCAVPSSPASADFLLVSLIKSLSATRDIAAADEEFNNGEDFWMRRN